MTRGRPRRYDPTIPAGINQRELPKGAYWDARDRVWYTLITGKGKAKRKRLAGAAATVADLHRLLQDLHTAGKGTIRWLHEQFIESDQWKKELKPTTQKDYTACLSCLARTPTKLGIQCDALMVDRLRRADVQNLVDTIAKKTPAMANHVKRYLGRLFAWGMQRNRMTERENPAHGLDAAKERGAFHMPERAVMARIIAFARDRGAYKPRTVGSCPPYLWIVMVLAYRCRLRGVEVLTLTDAHHHKDGILTNRRKGSRDNMPRWSPELVEAWAAALAYRKAVWARKRRLVPIRPEDRPLIVSATGEMLITLDDDGEYVARSSIDSAWRRFMICAIKAKVITPAERFTLHGLKHRGITDSKDKKSGGHVDPRMIPKYDHEVPLVDQAGD